MAAGNDSNANGVPLASVFCSDCIEQIPIYATKQAVLDQLLRSLVNAKRLSPTQVPEILKALMQRERVGSSALGKGLALPNLRTEAVNQFVGAIGLSLEGIHFDSLDGEPTKHVFLVLGPYDQRERHFEIMGRLSALVRDKTTLWFLKAQLAPSEVCEYLTELDARSSEGPESPGELVSTVAGSQQVTADPSRQH